MEMQGPSQLCTWPCPGKQDETSGLGTHTDLGPLPCPRGGVQRGQRRGVSLPWGWGALPAPPPVCHQSHFRSCDLISQEFTAQIPQEENVSKVRRGKCPLRLCLTDASCRRPPFPRAPVPPQPLSLHGSPWSCCLWTLEGLESQNDLQGAPGLAFPVTGRKTEPQQDEGMELGPLTNTQADHCLPHLFLFPASVQRPQAPPDAAVKRRRMGPGLGHRVLF